jgi:hypothetical protein
VLLFPQPDQIARFRKRLPRFASLPVRDLNGGDILDVRRKIDEQLAQLLGSMGIHPTEPNAWRRGFFMLANMHCGVGHLVWQPCKTNKNAAKLSSNDDWALFSAVMSMRRDGFSERAAIKALARTLAGDPDKQRLFPYPKKHRYTSNKRVTSPRTETQRIEDALRQRMRKIKKERIVWDGALAEWVG